MRNSKEITKS